jgi:tetratricopeptide (TPR) repeat protein
VTSTQYSRLFFEGAIQRVVIATCLMFYLSAPAQLHASQHINPAWLNAQETMRGIWSQRLQALAEGNEAVAWEKLQELERLKEKRGWPGLVLYAQALETEAVQWLELGENKRAKGLFEMALTLAPDSVSPANKLVVRKWLQGQYMSGWENVQRVAQQVLEDDFARVYTRSYLLIALTVALLLAASSFLGLSFFRQGRAVQWDLARILGNRVDLHALSWLGWVVILAPLYFRFGFVVTVLLAIGIAALYQGKQERYLSVAVLCGLATLPLTVLWAAHTWALYDSPTRERSECIRFYDIPCDLSSTGIDLKTQIITAYRKTWDGSYEQAQHEFELIAKKDPKIHWWTALGFNYARQDKLVEAEKAYTAALKIKPDSTLAHFNLARLYAQQSRPSESTQSLNQARLANEKDFERYCLRASALAADDIVLMGKPPIMLAQNAPQRHSTLVRIARLLWVGWVGANFYGYLLVLLLLALLLWGGGKLRQALTLTGCCVRCGSVAGAACEFLLDDAGVCNGCRQVVRDDSSTTFRLRLKRSVEIQRYALRRRRLALIFSAAWPGAGHVFNGTSIRGFGLSFLFVLGSLLALGLPQWALPSTFVWEPALAMLLRTPGAGLAVLTYIVALVSLVRSDYRGT